MKKLISLLLFLPLGVLFAHPIKMSLIYMDYDANDQSLFIECRLFSDDLTLGIEEELKQSIGEFNWTLKENELVNRFINQHIQISIGEQQLVFTPYETIFDKPQKVVFLRYEFHPIALIEGQKVTITNDILFNQFQYGQTNVLQIEIPRVAETMMQSDMDNYSITFKIKE